MKKPANMTKYNKATPTNKKWLFENKLALSQVKCGLEDSAHGRVKSKGSFAKYVDDKDN